MPLGLFITERRKQMGLSKAELARRCHHPRAYLYSLENGKTNNPTGRTILDLAGALHISPADILWHVNSDLECGAGGVHAKCELAVMSDPELDEVDRGQVVALIVQLKRNHSAA